MQSDAHTGTGADNGLIKYMSVGGKITDAGVVTDKFAGHIDDLGSGRRR